MPECLYRQSNDVKYHTILNLIPNLSPDLMPFQGANAAIAVSEAISMMRNIDLSQSDLVLFLTTSITKKR